jgi:hypothetical protein
MIKHAFSAIRVGRIGHSQNTLVSRCAESNVSLIRTLERYVLGPLGSTSKPGGDPAWAGAVALYGDI